MFSEKKANNFIEQKSEKFFNFEYVYEEVEKSGQLVNRNQSRYFVGQDENFSKFKI